MKKTEFNNNWKCNKKAVTLPHDAMLEAGRDPDCASTSAQAFYKGGIYTYEKIFNRPKAEHVLLQFEGVYKNAKVYVNGKEAGGKPYGYIPFFVSMDEYLTDGENTVRVECENENQPDSRWYSGAGIYRPVWLWEGPKGSIEPESVKISTLSVNPAVLSIDSPIAIKADVDGITGEGTHIELTIKDAKLWSVEAPYLYICKVRAGEDKEEISFGIRKVEWNNKGLYINGKETLLKGGCIHHSNGVLGAAAHDESEYRKVKLMKEAGFNAIRSSHNPTSRAILDACDELGMYLIDETWDMWFHHKNRYDYALDWRKNHEYDLSAMVNRDFNHPSVIMYSIGNEVSEPAKDEGVEVVRRMVEFLHKEDPNRAVTGGFNLMIISSAKKGRGIYDDENGGRKKNDSSKMQDMSSTMFNIITSMVGSGMNKSANSKAADEATAPALNLLDICGYNYASGRYPLEVKAHPDRVIFGSETFPQDIAKNWEMVKKYPYLIGDFMWTAIDYLGESGIGAWAYTPDGKGFNKPFPWLLADTGAIDIIGNPNGELFMAKAAWDISQKPMIAVQPINHDMKPAKAVWRGSNAIPSWSWQNCEGKKTVVEVYSNATTVELLINGSSLGKKKVKLCKAEFKVKYTPGTLTAVAYDATGKETGRSELISAKGEMKVMAAPEILKAKPGEIVYIPVSIEGENSVIESNADRKLRAKAIKGELLAFGSANPRTKENFLSNEYTTYYGCALAVVRADENGEYEITFERV